MKNHKTTVTGSSFKIQTRFCKNNATDVIIGNITGTLKSSHLIYHICFKTNHDVCFALVQTHQHLMTLIIIGFVMQ